MAIRKTSTSGLVLFAVMLLLMAGCAVSSADKAASMNTYGLCLNEKSEHARAELARRGITPEQCAEAQRHYAAESWATSRQMLHEAFRPRPVGPGYTR